MEQSANFPGREPLSRADFLLVRSRALLAASRARADPLHFSMIAFAVGGFSSRYSNNFSFTIVSIVPRTSLLPSFVLV